MAKQPHERPSFPTPQLPVAWGEVFDKLTILEIKHERLNDPEKKRNVLREHDSILSVVGDLKHYPEGLGALIAKLKQTNGELWDIEEGKRDCERRKCFDDSFIQLARQVYIGNDKRAAVKREINDLLGSELKEEKSYAAY
jgi:hypothetical protein